VVRMDFIGERWIVDFPASHSVDQRIEIARLVQEEAAGGACSAGCVRLLHELARDRSWRVRLEAAHALRVVDCGEVSELLAILARDSNRYVQQAAKQASKHQQSQRARRGRMQRRVDAVDTCIQELERRYDKQAVRSARKINSRLVELVVGAMVHDLRNVLTRLQANCYTVTRGYGARKNESRKVREDLKFLCSMLESMDKYSRPIDVAPEVVPLGQLLTAAIDQARATARSRGVEVDSIKFVNQAAGGQLVKAVPGPVVASLANILCNSLEAFAAGGGEKAPQIKITSSFCDGLVTIRIRDNGMGMSAEEFLSQTLFVPGRRNKFKRHSTGFGLANAERCFAALGGSLEIESSLETGTLVSIQIPGIED
jgi:signal transduction histidine kinase